jgi:hypothetical protein
VEQSQTFKGSRGLWVGFHGRQRHHPLDATLEHSCHEWRDSANNVSIQDCSKHMAEGGKKGTSYFVYLFEEKVLEYDPLRIYTDVFYFDGASNKQKTGDVLMARFPRSFCFHRGEHVVSSFFLSIAKIKPIKVQYAADTV